MAMVLAGTYDPAEIEDRLDTVSYQAARGDDLDVITEWASRMKDRPFDRLIATRVLDYIIKTKPAETIDLDLLGVWELSAKQALYSRLPKKAEEIFLALSNMAEASEHSIEDTPPAVDIALSAARTLELALPAVMDGYFGDRSPR